MFSLEIDNCCSFINSRKLADCCMIGVMFPNVPMVQLTILTTVVTHSLLSNDMRSVGA